VRDIEGLSAANYPAFVKALADPHSIRIDVAILTLNEDELSRLSPVILDGQVNVDADAPVTRSLTCTFLDPSHSLQLDSDSPDDGAVYADRMVRVTYSVYVPPLGDRVDVDVFTGPIVKFKRSGDQVELEAQGKEALALGWIWRPLTIKKGARKVDAIRTILEDRAGERRFDLPEIATAIPNPISLGRAASAWPRCQKIAHSMNRQLFYDGSGICRLRVRPRRPLFTFRAGHPTRPNTILTPVEVDHDFTVIRNAIWFKGGKPKGQKKAIEVFVAAPKGHPLSPIRLGRTNRDGKLSPRYLVEERTNEHIRSRVEARTRANALLDDLLLEVLGVTFSSVPVPHLDPLDVIRVQTDDFAANVRLRQFSLPLAASGQMTVGYIERVSKPHRGRRSGRAA
jgi:hypothetical protein